jgi:Nuclease-related domain
MRGEQKVALHLSEALGDEWLLVRGYRNRGGEIDQLLVGPMGVIAIEVKHRNATVHCDGDRWWFEKFDRYDNRVEKGWMTDRRGRSPSEQLRTPVRELEGFLSRRGHPVKITPVVVLTHPRSRLGSLQGLTVDVATRPDYVLELVGRNPRVMDGERCQALEQLIIQDHAFHEKRQRRSLSPR